MPVLRLTSSIQVGFNTLWSFVLPVKYFDVSINSLPVHYEFTAEYKNDENNDDNSNNSINIIIISSNNNNNTTIVIIILWRMKIFITITITQQ